MGEALGGGKLGALWIGDGRCHLSVARGSALLAASGGGVGLSCELSAVRVGFDTRSSRYCVDFIRYVTRDCRILSRFVVSVEFLHYRRFRFHGSTRESHNCSARLLGEIRVHHFHISCPAIQTRKSFPKARHEESRQQVRATPTHLSDAVVDAAGLECVDQLSHNKHLYYGRSGRYRGSR